MFLTNCKCYHPWSRGSCIIKRHLIGHFVLNVCGFVFHFKPLTKGVNLIFLHMGQLSEMFKKEPEISLITDMNTIHDVKYVSFNVDAVDIFLLH